MLAPAPVVPVVPRIQRFSIAVPGGSATTEDSTNYEIGWRRTDGTFRWDLSAYAYDIDNYIYQDLTGAEIDELPVAVYTQADAEFYG